MSALLAQVLRDIIEPAMKLLPEHMDTPLARLHMLAFGLQESRFVHRVQVTDNGPGPAHGLWQMERGGGVRGVLNHNASHALARRVCAARQVEPNSLAVWERLPHDDVLAACFARLLLWTDPVALPGPDDVEGAWRMYALRLWRPGKPHRKTWDGFFAQARKAVGL